MLASACHRGPDDTPPGPPLLQGLQKLDADLKIGDVGPNVRTVHDYLATYGYYPNADLAVQFPAWRPIANEPKDPNVFDQQTADAVRQLQVHYGLSPTGIVDGPTRAAMVTPRCGIPDGIARLDSSDKFSYGNVRWLQVIPTQVLGSSLPANVTLAQLVDATNQAAFTWEGATFLEINVGSGGGADGAGAGAWRRERHLLLQQSHHPIRSGRWAGKQVGSDVAVWSQRSGDPRQLGDLVDGHAAPSRACAREIPRRARSAAPPAAIPAARRLCRRRPPMEGCSIEGPIGGEDRICLWLLSVILFAVRRPRSRHRANPMH